MGDTIWRKAPLSQQVLNSAASYPHHKHPQNSQSKLFKSHYWIFHLNLLCLAASAQEDADILRLQPFVLGVADYTIFAKSIFMRQCIRPSILSLVVQSCDNYKISKKLQMGLHWIVPRSTAVKNTPRSPLMHNIWYTERLSQLYLAFSSM